MDYFADMEKIVNTSPLTVAATVLVLILGVLYFILKDRGLPPGPLGVPLLGCWPFLRDREVHLDLQEYAKKYGDVFSFKVTGQLFIHIGSIKALKEAHVTKSDCFTERFTQYSLLTLFSGEGVLTTNGEKWRALRKFFVQAFKEYGLISLKGYISGPIYDSVDACVDNLKKLNGSPVNIISIINDRSADILRRMMFNDGEITAEELKIALEYFQELAVLFTGKNLLLMGEFARYFVFPTIDGYKSAVEAHRKMVEHLRKLVKKHEQTYSENNIRDMIDSYIRERNERRKKSDPNAEYFTENAIVYSLVQFVGDGILTVSMFVSYVLHVLLEHPEEQENIYKELKEVIGFERQITVEDRSKLPYTNAFMQEVMRIADFFPLFPSLMCTKETTLNGYRIPKGAITVYNIWAIHHDPNVYDEPDKFCPSRYLIKPGKPKLEAPVLFGVGKRSCTGEAFVMMQAFLFLTNIVRNFRLERPKGEVKKNVLDGVMEVCAYSRK